MNRIKEKRVKSGRLAFGILAIAIMLSHVACVQRETNNVAADNPSIRWSEKKANDWYEKQPWIVGCNFVPSTAINQIETWQEDTFDPETIDKELGWAQDIGFNTVRIFLHNLVWEENPQGFKERLDQFLSIADKHHIRAIVTFFTNGTFHDSLPPKLGKQNPPIPGVHNSGWVQSPGAEIVNDSSKWEPLEKYIKDVIGTFKDDRRIVFWSVYNEPENPKRGAYSLPLLRKVFEWARSVNPSQPLTAPIWKIPGDDRTALDIVSFLGENCDIITFHSYHDPETTKKYIQLLKAFRRPMVCTEYMGRTRGSTFENTMPIFKNEHVGAISFGLVAGKANFYYPWGSKEGAPEPAVWFHDIFRQDGTPYSEKEVEFIKNMTGAAE
ncbi:glycoside hydrolase family 2 TIM barrel-domain containing protein [Sphingobacterium sp. SGG-5]|uniref:glycoside hydrolase family 2 TIM barrel-domain containing protein n=1 Tax=Sphingobacterium sp. SGG-5 TaxID=2710881 RepID=UPI0019D0D1A4|nr:glycoside hydrolase family 2 TIM barrel-domain containing protein [Sphingobacterium sp. SGG-5]